MMNTKEKVFVVIATLSAISVFSLGAWVLYSEAQSNRILVGRFFNDEQKTSLTGVNEIVLNTPYAIEVERGGQEYIQMLGNKTLFNQVTHSVDNGRLTISHPTYRPNYFWEINQLKIKIGVNYINLIEVYGSGTVKAHDLAGEHIDFVHKGTGDVMSYNNQSLSMRIVSTNSGTTLVYGNTQYLKVEQSGSGKVQLKDYIADAAHVESYGSGDVEVNIKNNLELKIIGSGNVLYRGDPQVSQTVFGSGKIKKM